ncbi:MAG: hypothetical protein ACLFVK_03385 [Dehalococcoidia bacterium]
MEIKQGHRERVQEQAGVWDVERVMNKEVWGLAPAAVLEGDRAVEEEVQAKDKAEVWGEVEDSADRHCQRKGRDGQDTCGDESCTVPG